MAKKTEKDFKVKNNFYLVEANRIRALINMYAESIGQPISAEAADEFLSKIIIGNSKFMCLPDMDSITNIRAELDCKAKEYLDNRNYEEALIVVAQLEQITSMINEHVV